MRHNQSNFVFMLIMICAPCMFGSLQPKVSVDWLKSIAALQRYQHEQYQLYSSGYEQSSLGRQLILRLMSGEKKTQSFSCFRLNSDTLLLSSVQTEGGDRFTFASMHRKRDSEEQCKGMSQFIGDIKDSIKHVAVMILYCAGDKGIIFSNDEILLEYQNRLKMIVDADLKMIGYCMVPGKDYRDKDHFECRITAKEVVWKSAIDNFQEQRL